MNKDFLSVTETARATGLSRTRILAIIHDGSGRLNAEKVGGVWIIPAGDVEKFIRSRTSKEGAIGMV